MSLRIAIRSLTIVLVVELALEPRVGAFSILRSPISDLSAAASEPLNFTDIAPVKNASVLPLTTSLNTANPIETTAKTEEIQKNALETNLTDGRSSDFNVIATNKNETPEVITEVSSTTKVNSYMSNSKDSTENTQQSIEDKKSVNVSTPMNFKQHEADLDTTTEKDNATSYSAQPVTQKSETLSNSKGKELNNGTGSSKYTLDASQLYPRQKGDTDTVAPYLKDNVIDMKRFKEKEMTTTEKDEDLIKSAQSHISLEKAFSISSDIPSLEKLKNDLSSLSTRTPTNSPELNSPVTEFIPTTDNLKTSDTKTASEYPRIDTMSSKRAGFLDYTSRTSSNAEKETVELTSTDKAIETTEATTITMDTTEKIKIITNKSVNKMASSRLAAEDALNEELMKEAIARNEPYKAYKNKIITHTKLIEDDADLTSEENTTDDKLSVKPIGSDKTKNTMLYTVSPNYRPMKKIEVQPPKTFARDPDDNSWRNESLSSLGIVFKANNSTKPFTQVLKNKTEIELNSLLDKYNKNSEQELRERLEIMSEKRKSKKKKVDKNGEVTYVDYEESNSGETATKGERYLNPLIPPLHEVSPLPSPPAIQNIFSSMFDLELNKTTLNNGTKNKTVIETFDVDDDDSDYITMPAQDIDIKKYMNSNTQPTASPPATASPPPTTKPSYPERKATVQYFPPLPKHVNVDDYEDSYQDKINSYTIRNAAKNIPTPFTTPLPTAGEYGKKIATTGTTYSPRRQPNSDRIVYQTNDGTSDDYPREPSIITNLKDFMKDVLKVENEGYVPPVPITTSAPIAKPSGDYFDYDLQFRKNVIDKFMEHYNAQNEKYASVGYPVVYNSSIVHSIPDNSGKIQASSNAFMRRMFEDAVAARSRLQDKNDPECDRVVELSPAYELHYYVPDDFVPENGAKLEPLPIVPPKPVSPFHYRI